MKNNNITNSVKPSLLDAYTPAEIAHKVQYTGVTKAELSVIKTLVLAILAGAFIAFGAMFFTMVITGSPFGFGPSRLLGGAAFSLGLILVVVAGAELFTGNNLIVMAWASRHITGRQVLRNWLLVYLGNLLGTVATAWLVYQSGVLEIQGGVMTETAIAIADQKVALEFKQAFFRGILCNVMVCLAMWLCMGAHSVSGKILAILFPITAFVSMGFEHSIANMYFLSLGYLLDSENVNVLSMTANLIPVTLGNIVGGSVLVALVYWLAYLRQP
jgi:formate/nitrite transporter